MITQGGESNFNGRWLEGLIETECRNRGIPARDYAEERDNYDLFQPNVLIRRVPYTSIYGSASTSEFVLQLEERRIRIECRVQETGGSVDEKFPFLFLNARDRMPEPEVHLVMHGDGARPQALEWLRRQCRAVGSREILVLSISDWRAWLRQNFVRRVPA